MFIYNTVWEIFLSITKKNSNKILMNEPIKQNEI